MLSDFDHIGIDYVGDISSYNCAPITAAAVSGILSPSLPDINMVSAPAIAREKGIAITETKKEASSAYESYIRIFVMSGKNNFSIGGTVFSDGNPRIVQINGINLESELVKNMLYVTNKDVPGLIGHLGSILGEDNINIASYILSREVKNKSAYSVVKVDEKISNQIIKEITLLEEIETINQIELK